MSKKSCPIFIEYLQIKIGQEFLEIQYKPIKLTFQSYVTNPEWDNRGKGDTSQEILGNKILIVIDMVLILDGNSDKTCGLISII